jgi:hypothetical protein
MSRGGVANAIAAAWQQRKTGASASDRGKTRVGGVASRINNLS